MSDPLVARVYVRGHQGPLSELNSKFRASLVSYFARRLRDRSEIDDLVQEVFLRLAKRGHLENVEQIGGYIFETASSVLTDRQRKRRVRCADQHCDISERDHRDEASSSPLDVLLAREQLASATTILLELSERTRVIFVLSRLEGMKYRDISKRLGISVSAVEKHVARAVLHLMKRVGEVEK